MTLDSFKHESMELIVGRQRIGMSPAASDVAAVLGHQIRLARQDRTWTAAELGERAGVSERTVLAAEAGVASTSIGNVLNIAVAAGVPLFAAESAEELARIRRRGEERLSLIPSRVVHPRKAGDVRFDF